MGSNTPSHIPVTLNDSVSASMREIHKALQAAEETKTRNGLLQKKVSEAASCTKSMESMDRKFNHWIANVDTTNLFPDELNQEIHRHKMEQNFADNISNRVQTNFNWLCGFVNEVASFWQAKNEREKGNMRMERLQNFWNEMKPSNAEINELVQNSEKTPPVLLPSSSQPSTSKYGQNIPLANTSASTPEKRSRSITPPSSLPQPPQNPPQLVLALSNQMRMIAQSHPSYQLSNRSLEKIKISRKMHKKRFKNPYQSPNQQKNN